LVNVEPARPTKLAAVPKLGATAPGLAMASGEGPPDATRSVVKMNKIVKYLSFCMM
jgi:hypothetical protein